uniref:Uncharacterized protein n=1 Tax=Tetranychus urticae TaxID=32264 RepID=T1JWQ4_TETUR
MKLTVKMGKPKGELSSKKLNKPRLNKAASKRSNRPFDPIIAVRCESMVKIFQSRYRLIITLLFFVAAGYICLTQIWILTKILSKLETVLVEKNIQSKNLVPPNFSFCFDIMRFLNTTKLFKNFPDILKRTIEEQKAIPYLKNWTLHQIIAEHELGEKFTLSMLTVGELASNMLPFAAIMDKCYFLTSSLTIAPCNSSYFQTYIFNCLYCFEFTWFPGGRPNKPSPSFNPKGLQTPGYHDLRLLDMHLNLSLVSGTNEIIAFAHQPGRIPWKEESDLLKLATPASTSIVYGLTYAETVKINLGDPYPTKCTDENMKVKASSDHSCWHNCSANQFSESTGFYPRYSIIRDGGDKKILDSYHKQERYNSLINKLQRQCVQKCGRTECTERKFAVYTLYNPSRFSPNGKYVVIHYAPPSYNPRSYQLMPAFGVGLYWASVQNIISFLFGVNYHSMFCFFADAFHNWLVSLYLKTFNGKSQ